jgi:hypothetical protein
VLWKVVKNLKPLAIVVAILVWNAICLVGIWLNGGLGRIETLGSGIAMAVACGLLSATAFLGATSSTWQRIALRPGADPNEPRSGLLFIGFLGAVLMVGGIISAIQSTSHT